MTTLLHWGLHPDASQALISVGVSADRIVQTIGSAPASHGIHLQDGTAQGLPYCAAVDFSVHHPSQMEDHDIQDFLSKIAKVGFAGWYRNPGHDHWPASEPAHIHAVFAGCPMKEELRSQIHDWLHGKNGLASHAAYEFWQPSQEWKNTVRALLLAHNPMDG